MDPRQKAKTFSSGDDLRARIFIVDDHPVFRHGLKQLIDHEPDLHVCGEAGDAASALEAIARLKPTLVILDIELNGSDGLVLTRTLHSRDSRLLLMVVSVHRESLFAERALRAGARGYVIKQEPPNVLIGAMRKVLRGELYVSEALGPRVASLLADGIPLDSQSPLQSLSDRELQVFRLIGRGKGTREIADQLSLSIKTIESYRAHIKEKMNLETASELVQAAIYWVQQEKEN